MSKESESAHAGALMSMTGIGHALVNRQGMFLTVTLKSINHRHIEVKSRLPEELYHLEAKVSGVVARQCARGRFDVEIKLDYKDESPTILLHERLDPMIKEMSNLKILYPELNFQVTLSDLLTLVKKTHSTHHHNNNLLDELVEEALDRACCDLIEARLVEGKALAKLIHEMLTKAQQYLVSINARASAQISSRYEALKARLGELFSDIKFSEERLYQELAILCERADFKEEIDRLHAHVDHFYSIMRSSGPKGRKLDFLCQEMLREAGTLLSKAQESPVMVMAIELKALVERIREQIQNIE